MRLSILMLLYFFLKNDKEKQKKADQEWKETETEMKRLLNKGAEFCYLEGLIDSDTKQKYTMSGMYQIRVISLVVVKGFMLHIG